MPVKIYYEKDADIKDLENETVGIIGYGIQGSNQAFNLRDNKIKVIISNKKDSYCEQAIEDGFEVYDLEELVKKASIIMMLIPDQAHEDIFNNIKGKLNQGTMLVVAHGYSIRFKKVIPPKNIDVIMLAPRFPGAVLRKNFVENKGTLAYFDVYQDFTNSAEKRGLSLANAIGFTNGGTGILGVTLEEETEVDLFIEQFLIPSFLNTIQTGFDVLAENGYTPEITLMELYTSGEIIGLLKEGIESGLYKAFQNNTSPTCQFGVKESFNRIITGNTKETAEIILKEIKSGDFSKRLDQEAKKGYSKLKEFNKKNNQNNLSNVQQKLQKIIK